MNHSLSYSHADQALFRAQDLHPCWDSLVVPGTVATFYLQGTGGFIFNLRRQYIIDPRTPLLQELPALNRPEPRKSHLELARVHHVNTLDHWPAKEIPAAWWSATGHWQEAIDRILEFQLQYKSTANKKMAKYAAWIREGRGEDPTVGHDPLAIVPPYWAVTGVKDPWWDLSLEAIEQSQRRPEIAAGQHRLKPILTLKNEAATATFGDLIAQLPEGIDQVFCWRSSWDEADATADDVAGWLSSVDVARDRGVVVDNLYGGFLSVLLTALGLNGVNHGVGYSEHRHAFRLGSTGAAPARYYVPALHGFLSVPDAAAVHPRLPEEWRCGCEVCSAAAGPGSLTPEQLKRHFLLARAAECRAVEAGPRAQIDHMREVAAWMHAEQMPIPAFERRREVLASWTAIMSGYF